MAKYRQIHVHIWKDGWFLDLDPKSKLFFIYLFTNERASISGIYELAKRVMSFESGLSSDEIDAAFEVFSQEEKAYYEDGVVWIANLRRYHESKSPKVQKYIAEDVAKLKDCKLKGIYTEIYGIDTLSEEENTVFSEENTVRSRIRSSIRSRNSSKDGESPKPEDPESLPPLPSFIASPALLNVWGEWVQYQIESGHSLTFRTAKGQQDKFIRWGEKRSIAAMDYSMDQGYKGLVEPKEELQSKQQKPKVPSQGLKPVEPGVY